MASIKDLREKAEFAARQAVPEWQHIAITGLGFLLVSIPVAFITSLSYLGAPLPVATIKNGNIACTPLLKCSHNNTMKVVYQPLNTVFDIALFYAVSIFAVFGFRRWRA